MATREQEIESAAMQMPRSFRAQLAERLLGSLDEDDEVEAAWAAEIERRVQEIDSGAVKLIPGKEAMAHLRARIRR